MRQLIMLAAALAATAGVAQAQKAKPAAPAAPVDLVLSCEGPIGAGSDEAAIVAAFGAENVAREDVYVGEGYSEPGLVVWPDDPERRLEILWADTEEPGTPGAIILREGSLWRIAVGDGRTIGLGQSLAEVEMLNGRPFELTGFGWDYGGGVTDWLGGRLDALEGGCRPSPRFDPAADADPDAMGAVSGDSFFRSDEPAMRATRPTVWMMTLSFVP